MEVFRCVESPGDHIGIADYDSRIVIVVVEHGAGVGDTDATAQLDIDVDSARRLATRLRALINGSGEHGTYAGLWIAEAVEERGFILSIGPTDAQKRSVILSRDDTSLFCHELLKAADRAYLGGTSAQARMMRRTLALRMVTAAWGKNVTVWEAAAWVADSGCEFPPMPEGIRA